MPGTTPTAPRVAIYARFSSVLQNQTSIEDQVRLCRRRAHDLGGTVVRVRSDHASTGTTTQSRPGLENLLLDAENGHIDVVVAEALDRLSRDQEDMARIHKRLSYWNVRLVTLEEGDIEAIHICIGGLMNQAWIDNLAAKTRRGQIGAVHAGRIPGGLLYGYKIANRNDENGQVTRGHREIHPQQAEIVQRIYWLYAHGASAREIAAKLNAEAIPGPRGHAWGQSCINGNRTRRNGILNNEVYRGRLIYGRQKFIRDPDTGKRQARTQPQSEWVIRDVPELRIVGDPLWDRVQKRRLAGQDRRTSPAPRTPLPLTGLLRCGQCGGNMTIVNKRRYACHAHREKRTCSNPRGIDAERIENELCSLLAIHITKQGDPPALIHSAVTESHRRRQELPAAIANHNQRITRLLHSIESGTESASAHRRILELEQETRALEAELASLPDIPTHIPERFSTRLRDRLATIARAISNADTTSDKRLQALLLAAGLVERIDIVPLPGRGCIDIQIHPRKHALVTLALQDNWKFHGIDQADTP